MQFPVLVWKVKTAGVFFLCIINPLGLLSCLEQACEHTIYKYIFSSEVQVCRDGGAFWRKSAYQACLILLRQFVKSKEAREREGQRKWKRGRKSKEQPRVKKPHDCGSCQTHSPARSSCHKAHSWRTHLDRGNQSWLFFCFLFCLTSNFTLSVVIVRLSFCYSLCFTYYGHHKLGVIQEFCCQGSSALELPTWGQKACRFSKSLLKILLYIIYRLALELKSRFLVLSYAFTYFAFYPLRIFLRSFVFHLTTILLYYYFTLFFIVFLCSCIFLRFYSAHVMSSFIVFYLY